MPVTWRRSAEQYMDPHVLLANRPSPQAWAAQQEGTQQAPLTSLLIHKPATAALKHPPSSPDARSSRTPERVTRSQPASPARNRRISGDRAQQYALRSSNPTGAPATSSFSAANTNSPSRTQTGFWNRTYGNRPASNPAPSRAGSTPNHAGPGSGRSATPGRIPASSAGAQPAWGYMSGGAAAASQPAPQLGDLFTAQALKVPQHMAHSPYLNSSRTAYTSSSVLQPSNPYSPKPRSSNSSNNCASGSQSQQFTTSGDGGLTAASLDPVARAKLSYAFSFQRTATNNGSKVSPTNSAPPAPETCSSPEPMFRPSRGPGALVAHSPHSPPAQGSNTGSSTTTARSSTFRSGRYTSGSVNASTSSMSRQRTPPAASSASSSTSSSMSNLALSAHKQSLRQHQQQVQLRQQQQKQQQVPAQQPPQHAWMESHASLDQPQLSQQTSNQAPSQVQLTFNASSQLSGLGILGPSSSSSVSGRPLTAKGSSRAELRSEVTPPTPGGTFQHLGVNLDPQSWSTFLSVAAGNGASPGAAAAAAAALGIGVPVVQHDVAADAAATAARVQQHQLVAVSQSAPHPAVRSSSLQSQMLADLGLGGLPVNSAAAAAASRSSVAAATAYDSHPGRYDPGGTSGASGALSASAVPQKQPSGAVTLPIPDPAVSLASSSVSSSASSNSSTTGFVSTRASLNSCGSSTAAAKSILGTAAASLSTHVGHMAHAMDSMDAAASPLVVSRRSFDSSSIVDAGPAAATAAAPGPVRAASPAAVPGPLHAGLLRPRSGQNVLHQVAQQQQQQHLQQPSSPQHQSFLSSLQQQQQQQQQQQTANGSSDIDSNSPQQLHRPDALRHSASPGVKFVQTPSGGLRRKSVTDIPTQSPQEQQGTNSSSDSPVGPHAAATAGGPGRDYATAAGVAASAAGTAAASQGSPGSSQAGSPYRRPSEVGASGSPLARLQSDQWGTLTALSRGSGFGPGASGFDSELSADCHSAGSWASAGGATSFAGTAAAAAGFSTPPGPGPSPLGVSSTGSAVSGTPNNSTHTSAAAGSSGAAASVRRALQFADSPPSSNSSSGSITASVVSVSGAACAAPGNSAIAVEATVDAARHRLSNNSRGNSVTSQQQQQVQQLRTSSRDGSIAMYQSQVVPAAKPAQQPAQQQQQQQDKQQYLQQLQQQQQALHHANAGSSSAEQHSVSKPSSQPGAVRPGDMHEMPAGPLAAAVVQSSRQSAASAASAAVSQQRQSVMQQQQPGDAEPKKEQKRTVSDYGEEETAPATTTTAAASSQAASTAATAAAAPSGSGGDDDDAMLLPGYSVSRVVGEGGFCQVRLATHHLSRRKVAVKVIDKTKLSDHNEASRIQREIRVLKRLNHPAIIRLFEVLEAGSKLFLVMEYAPAGSLLDYVRSRKRLSEGEAAFFLQQIVAGLQYCHDNEVVHRDIKLENILLDATNNMKLIDFGLAAFYAPGKKLRVHCGSPSYAAPEIVARKLYDGPPVDVWSLGVVLFAMMAGFLPFHSPTGNKQELCQKIMAGTYNAPDWLSPAAKDLLSRMLTVDPDRRITLAEVAAHPWTTGSGPAWQMPTVNCYAAPAATQAANGTEEVAVDQQILAELESHGYPRATSLRYLAAGEANYVTASYYLLSEGRAEAARKLLPAKPWPFQPVVIHSSRSGSSRSSGQRTAATAAAGGSTRSGTSAQVAAAAASAACSAIGTAGYAAKPVAAVAVS